MRKIIMLFCILAGLVSAWPCNVDAHCLHKAIKDIGVYDSEGVRMATVSSGTHFEILDQDMGKGQFLKVQIPGKGEFLHGCIKKKDIDHKSKFMSVIKEIGC